MKRNRLLALFLVTLFLLALPISGLAYVGSWQAGDNGYVFISSDSDAPKAVCEKVEIQGGVFYYDAATGIYYDKFGQDVTYTVYSGERQLEVPAAEGPITVAETGSVAFSNGKSVLTYKTADGKEYYPTPEELMSAMGRIDFLIFIGDVPSTGCNHHHHHHHHPHGGNGGPV